MMKSLIRVVVVLAAATSGTILVLIAFALRGVTVFDVQLGDRYVVVSTTYVLPWLVFTGCILIVMAKYLRRRYERRGV